MILRVEFQFNAAHRLPYYEGPCFHTHGHNYKLLVFVEVKELVRTHVLAEIDHNDFNRILDNPTAENVVIWMWGRLKPHLPGLLEMQLYEMDDSAVIYRGELDAEAEKKPA